MSKRQLFILQIEGNPLFNADFIFKILSNGMTYSRSLDGKIHFLLFDKIYANKSKLAIVISVTTLILLVIFMAW